VEAGGHGHSTANRLKSNDRYGGSSQRQKFGFAD
jgi:hypothetical protein